MWEENLLTPKWNLGRRINKETSLRESGGDLRRKKSWEMKENAGYH